MSLNHANGRVKLELYKGNVIVIGRESSNDSLFNAAYCTFEEDEVYNQKTQQALSSLMLCVLSSQEKWKKILIKE